METKPDKNNPNQTLITKEDTQRSENKEDKRGRGKKTNK